MRASRKLRNYRFEVVVAGIVLFFVGAAIFAHARQRQRVEFFCKLFRNPTTTPAQAELAFAEIVERTTVRTMLGPDGLIELGDVHGRSPFGCSLRKVEGRWAVVEWRISSE